MIKADQLVLRDCGKRVCLAIVIVKSTSNMPGARLRHCADLPSPQPLMGHSRLRSYLSSAPLGAVSLATAPYLPVRDLALRRTHVPCVCPARAQNANSNRATSRHRRMLLRRASNGEGSSFSGVRNPWPGLFQSARKKVNGNQAHSKAAFRSAQSSSNRCPMMKSLLGNRFNAGAS